MFHLDTIFFLDLLFVAFSFRAQKSEREKNANYEHDLAQNLNESWMFENYIKDFILKKDSF